jgi:glutamyl-tRNA synthetase
MVRVRFAPSPTGYLHIGGARTALFNWLFARRRGGAFVLRIEDTDIDRSSPEMVQGILDGLRWLGLDWDEGPGTDGPFAPYFQSERRPRYRALAERLVADGHAYYCYCTAAEIQQKRSTAEDSSGGWRYDRTCRGLPSDEIARRERAGQPRAIRFETPPGIVRFEDLVHGVIEVDAGVLEDFIILRSDGHPTYHLSVVADDVEMGITAVVRGDDHISNTPKQILLYQALGAPLPAFAHVPLILGPDRKRLSKRHGATSVMEYARQGYLPEAMLNFLALLGWSPGSGNQEIFTRDELVQAFDLRGISGGNAVFNPEKLDWFNQQYMMRLSPDELARRVRPFFEAAGLWSDGFLAERHLWFLAVLEQLRPRVKRLDELATAGQYFFSDDIHYEQAAVEKHLRVDGMSGHLSALDGRFRELPSFDPASLEATLRATAVDRGLKAASLIHAVRVAITGRTASPGLFDVVALVGRERTHDRLVRAASLAAGSSS